MVNTTPYPDAPGESGSVANIAKLLGVGAYTIDDSSQGSGLNFGQDVGTETFVKSLIYSVAMGMGTGDGTITSALNNLGTYLQTMSLDSLKLLQPYVPNTTPDDFSTVETAVEKTLAMFQMGSGALNVDDFNNWVETLLDPFAEIWDQVQKGWDQLLDIFQNNVTVPINAGVQAVKDWWVNYQTSLPGWDSTQTDWANFIAQLDTLFGTPTTAADAATQIANSKAKWDAMLAAWGIGSATAGGAQLADNDTKLTTQQAWWARLPENILISLDGLHLFYPLGSPSDTPTTTVGGKRTWYAAKADMALMQGQTNGTSTPTVTFDDVGTFATDTKTQVVVNEGTLAQVQADVDALKTADASVAGAKFIETAAGGSTSWGSDWTVTTSGTTTPKTNIDVFDQNLPGSSSVDLVLKGNYNAGVTLTDNQIASMVLYEPAKSMNGGVGPQNVLKARMDATGDNYIFVRVNYTTVQLGMVKAGVETVFATVTGVSVPAGSLVELYAGNAGGPRNYLVRVNATAIITGSESGGSLSNVGASYRGGGMDMIASHGAFNDVWPAATIRQWKLQDSSVGAQTYGTSARVYRASATGTPVGGIARGVIQVLGSAYFDTIDYMSPDLQLVANGFAISTPGRYRITTGVKISNASGSWSIAAAASPSYATLCKITSGPTVTSIGASDFKTSTVLGLGGSWSFNAVGDGGATELWAPGVALAGTGAVYYVLGDGLGEGTWATIERIG
jgi:hypothetical protein